MKIVLRKEIELIKSESTMITPALVIIKIISKTEVFLGSKVIKTSTLRKEIRKLEPLQMMMMFVDNEWFNVAAIFNGEDGEEVFLTNDEMKKEMKEWRNE